MAKILNTKKKTLLDCKRAQVFKIPTTKPKKNIHLIAFAVLIQFKFKDQPTNVIFNKLAVGLAG